MNDESRRTRAIVTVALMAALVLVFSYIQIIIPTPLGKTRLHLGNVMCLLAALLFGKTKGGLAAGLGSMFFDLFDPVYLPECWITFIMKFTMAFVCGAVAHSGSKPLGANDGSGEKKSRASARQIIGAVCGALSYVVLYVGKTFVVERLVKGYELETVLVTMTTKGTVSLVNALIAVAASLLLAAALRPALKKAGLADKAGMLG